MSGQVPKPQTSIQRIEGYLHQVPPIIEVAGKVVGHAVRPYHGRDSAQRNY